MSTLESWEAALKALQYEKRDLVAAHHWTRGKTSPLHYHRTYAGQRLVITRQEDDRWDYAIDGQAHEMTFETIVEARFRAAEHVQAEDRAIILAEIERLKATESAK